MSKLTRGGFSLIEVLISLFVLTLGVIGAAGMQLTALHTSQQSASQSAALQLASEMADRMRANDNQMKLDAGNPFLAVDYKSSDGEPAAPGKLCYDGQCNAKELAQFDIYEWEKRVKAALPGGRALICRDPVPWDKTAKTFTWACKTGAGNGAPLVIKLGWLGKGRSPDGSLTDSGKSFPPGVAIIVRTYTQ